MTFNNAASMMRVLNSSRQHFGTFKQGTCLQYSETDLDSWEVGLHTVTIDGDSLCYFHDVIEPGDILPCYNDIVFKVGHIGGPMFLIILEDETGRDPDDPIPPGPQRPKRKNISHTVLKLADREVPLSPTGIIPVTMTTSNSLYYNLQGTRVLIPQKGIHIKDGRKIIIR